MRDVVFDALLSRPCAWLQTGRVGLAVPVIPEVKVDVNTTVVNTTGAAAPVAEDDVPLLEAAADADMEVLVPSATPKCRFCHH